MSVAAEVCKHSHTLHLQESATFRSAAPGLCAGGAEARGAAAPTLRMAGQFLPLL